MQQSGMRGGGNLGNSMVERGELGSHMGRGRGRTGANFGRGSGAYYD
jgi:hypothetical protein